MAKTHNNFQILHIPAEEKLFINLFTKMLELSAKEKWVYQAKISVIRILEVAWSESPVEVYVPENYLDMIRRLPMANDKAFEDCIVRVTA